MKVDICTTASGVGECNVILFKSIICVKSIAKKETIIQRFNLLFSLRDTLKCALLCFLSRMVSLMHGMTSSKVNSMLSSCSPFFNKKLNEM